GQPPTRTTARCSAAWVELRHWRLRDRSLAITRWFRETLPICCGEWGGAICAKLWLRFGGSVRVSRCIVCRLLPRFVGNRPPTHSVTPEFCAHAPRDH